MTEAVVASRKKQIDEIVGGVRKESWISVASVGWRLVYMSTSINQDAIMGLMKPNEGITEGERVELQNYNKAAHEKLRS